VANEGNKKVTFKFGEMVTDLLPLYDRKIIMNKNEDHMSKKFKIKSNDSERGHTSTGKRRMAGKGSKGIS
jgi:hypothetical protein